MKCKFFLIIPFPFDFRFVNNVKLYWFRIDILTFL